MDPEVLTDLAGTVTGVCIRSITGQECSGCIEGKCFLRKEGACAEILTEYLQKVSVKAQETGRLELIVESLYGLKGLPKIPMLVMRRLEENFIKDFLKTEKTLKAMEKELEDALQVSEEWKKENQKLKNKIEEIEREQEEWRDLKFLPLRQRLRELGLWREEKDSTEEEVSGQQKEKILERCRNSMEEKLNSMVESFGKRIKEGEKEQKELILEQATALANLKTSLLGGEMARKKLDESVEERLAKMEALDEEEEKGGKQDWLRGARDLLREEVESGKLASGSLFFKGELQRPPCPSRAEADQKCEKNGEKKGEDQNKALQEDGEKGEMGEESPKILLAEAMKGAKKAEEATKKGEDQEATQEKEKEKGKERFLISPPAAVRGSAYELSPSIAANEEEKSPEMSAKDMTELLMLNVDVGGKDLRKEWSEPSKGEQAQPFLHKQPSDKDQKKAKSAWEQVMAQGTTKRKKNEEVLDITSPEPAQKRKKNEDKKGQEKKKPKAEPKKRGQKAKAGPKKKAGAKKLGRPPKTDKK